jgi:hypothetical protein
MDKDNFFEKNLLALSKRNRELSIRLSKTTIKTKTSRYKFLPSRSGEMIPNWIDAQGAAHPLHSMIDPRKEAKRLVETIQSEGFIVLLGLGAGFYAEEALGREGIGFVLVVEYDLGGLTELFRNIDYTSLFEDSRFSLAVDLSGEEVKRLILSLYQPVLFGGIKVIPLRSRTSLQAESFIIAAKAIEGAIDRVSSDYSVQARFGRRWLSNILRNLKNPCGIHGGLPTAKKAAVCAAGPSLSLQIPAIQKKRGETFLIAVDTSLPCLLNAGITPDAVISIDCQHISYYHFMDGLPEGVLLFLDLASPPLLALSSKSFLFFTSAHPLTRYISQFWKSLPGLDTSGGNVTYAAVSLAEQMGASEIELYGADFSYPGGVSYARGAYIYSLFAKCQNRLSPLEAQCSDFLYRTPLEKITYRSDDGADSWYYENRLLKFYRQRLEEKSLYMEAALFPAKGLGAPICVKQAENRMQNHKTFSSSKAATQAEDFLLLYKNKIAGLPKPEKSIALYLESLDDEERAVFATILPLACFIKNRNHIGDYRELIEEAKAYTITQIDKVLADCNS